MNTSFRLFVNYLKIRVLMQLPLNVICRKGFRIWYRSVHKQKIISPPAADGTRPDHDALTAYFSGTVREHPAHPYWEATPSWNKSLNYWKNKTKWIRVTKLMPNLKLLTVETTDATDIDFFYRKHNIRWMTYYRGKSALP